MSDGIILSIVGTFISFGLTINAFFLRGILGDLNDVKIQIAQVLIRSENIIKNEKSIKELWKEVEYIRSSIGRLEIQLANIDLINKRNENVTKIN